MLFRSPALSDTGVQGGSDVLDSGGGINLPLPTAPCAMAVKKPRKPRTPKASAPPDQSKASFLCSVVEIESEETIVGQNTISNFWLLLCCCSNHFKHISCLSGSPDAKKKRRRSTPKVPKEENVEWKKTNEEKSPSETKKRKTSKEATELALVSDGSLPDGAPLLLADRKSVV